MLSQHLHRAAPDKRSLVLLAALITTLPTSDAAADVLLMVPSGPLGARIADALTRAIATDVPGHTVLLAEQPRDDATGGRRKQDLLRLARAQRATFVVEAARQGRFIDMIVLAQGGKTIHTDHINATTRGQKSRLDKHARRAARAIAVASGGEEKTHDVPPQPPSVAANAGGADWDAAPTMALWAALSVAGINATDVIASKTPGGGLDLRIPLATATRGSITMALGPDLDVNLVTELGRARFTHDTPTTPAVIDATTVTTTALLGHKIWRGFADVFVAAGGRYSALSADTQTPAVVVPSWKRALLLAGIYARWHDHRDALSADLRLISSPWGRHKESPVTTGARTSVRGVLGQAVLRFQFPRAFGDGGGFFLQLAGDAELLWIKHDGQGNRTAPGTDTPVAGGTQERRVVSVAAGAGYSFF